MTKEEILDICNAYLSQINNIAERVNKLVEEFNNAPEQADVIDDDFLKDYNTVQPNDTIYFINQCCELQVGSTGNKSTIQDPFDAQPYLNYHTEEYAKKAQKLKKFNDMLLAFKWCYDRYYVPDWTAKKLKYCIGYNPADGRYDICSYASWLYSMVYFSSRDIAQKCVDWLNNIDPKGELIS
jgi:hypothetical protein